MLVTVPPQIRRKSGSLEFASSLYLHPVLEFLMAEVPTLWQPEIRLGLQEALVNAVRHGNGLDPTKKVIAQYSVEEGVFIWRITDQGAETPINLYVPSDTPCPYSEQGRGIFILHQIFDRVEWYPQKHTLYLEKHITLYNRPFIL